MLSFKTLTITLLMISQIIAQTCPLPQIVNPFTGQCGCVNFLTKCTAPKSVKDSNCKCVCPADSTCGSPKAINSDTCVCECPSNPLCVSPQKVNPNTCKCECPNKATTKCSFWQVWKHDECVCKCRLPGFCISATKIWDKTVCRCLKVAP